MNKIFQKMIKDHKNTICFKSVDNNIGTKVAGYLFLENNSRTANELYYLGNKYLPGHAHFYAESLMGLKPDHRFSRGDHAGRKKVYFIGKVFDFKDKPMVTVDEFVSYKEYLKFIRENQETRKKLAYSGKYLIDSLHESLFGGKKREHGECLVIGSDVYNKEGKYIGSSGEFLASNGDFVGRYF